MTKRSLGHKPLPSYPLPYCSTRVGTEGMDQLAQHPTLLQVDITPKFQETINPKDVQKVAKEPKEVQEEQIIQRSDREKSN